MGTEAVAVALYAAPLPNQAPWRRSSDPVRRPAKEEASIGTLAPSHHGEAEAARSSSAEALLHRMSSRRSLREVRWARNEVCLTRLVAFQHARPSVHASGAGHGPGVPGHTVSSPALQ